MLLCGMFTASAHAQSNLPCCESEYYVYPLRIHFRLKHDVACRGTQLFMDSHNNTRIL